MTAPWPSPARPTPSASSAAVPSGGAAPAPSVAAGYDQRVTRGATDRAARTTLAAAARTARDRLGDAQRAWADARRLDAAAQLEGVQGRLARLIDRLESPPATGAWLNTPSLPEGAAAWLSDVDRRIGVALAELAATAETAATAATAASAASAAGAEASEVGACDAVILEALTLLDRRRGAMAAAQWSPQAPPAGLDAVVPGDGVVSDGRSHRAVEVMRFARGDVGVALDDGLVLWEDTDGVRVAFEAAEGAPPAVPPPAVVELADDTFRLRWADDGAGIVRGAWGRRRVSSPRWLLAGDAGGWLWLTRPAPEGDAAAWRGVRAED